MRSTTRILALAAALPALSAARTARGAGDVEVVLRPGDEVDGRRVSSVGPPVVNADGQIACEVVNSQGGGAQIVRIGTGGAQVVARSGDTAPGTDAAVFERFPDSSGSGVGHLVLADGGTLLFEGLLEDGVGDASTAAQNRNGLWIGTPGAIELVARDAGPVPGFATTLELELSHFAYSDAGLLAVSARPTSGDDRFLLHGAPTALTSRGQSPSVDAPVVNGAGYTLWSGNFGFFPTTSDYANEIDGGTVTTIWSKGDDVPGVAGATFSGFDVLCLDSEGTYVATATLDPGGNALLTGSGATRTLLFRQGDAIPGTSATYVSARSAAISDSGHVAWIGGFNTDESDVLFISGPAGVHEFARPGTQAPGLPPGVEFDGIDGACMNGKGEVAILTDLSGGGSSSFDGTDQAFWIARPDGTLTLLLRGGELEFERVPGGSLEPLREFTLAGDTQRIAGPHDGRERWFDDAGDVVFRSELGFSTAIVRARAGGPAPGFALTKGDVTDSAQAGKDKVALSGKFAKAGAAFDPRGAGATVRFGDPAAPVVVDVPAGDPGWRGKKGNFTWKTPKGSAPQIAVNVNGAKGTFRVTASKIDLAVAPPASFLASLTAGGHAGEATVTFADKGKGRFRYRD